MTLPGARPAQSPATGNRTVREGSANSPAHEQDPATQVAAIENYYNATINQLSNRNLRALGTEGISTDGSVIRDIVFRVALVKAGVNFDRLTLPGGMSQPDISRLVFRKGEIKHDNLDRPYMEKVDINEEIGRFFIDAAETAALQEAGINQSKFQKMLRNPGKNGSVISAIDSRAREISRVLYTDPEVARRTAAFTSYIDHIPKQLLFTRLGGRERREWTNERMDTMKRTLGLTDDEAEQVASYSLMPDRAANNPDVYVYGWREGKVQTIELMSHEIWSTDTYDVGRSIVHGDNTGLVVARRHGDGRVEQELHSMPADHHDFFNQYALIGKIWAEEAIKNGSTRAAF